jgi:hypothetical protein
MKSTNVLTIAALAFGMITGVGIYEHLFGLPDMLKSQEALNAAMQKNPRVPFFWIPLHAIVFISLIIGLILNWKNNHRKRLLIFVFGAYFFVSLVSIYFARELFEFTTMNVSPAEFTNRTTNWIMMSWFRPIIYFISQILLLVALARPQPQ